MAGPPPVAGKNPEWRLQHPLRTRALLADPQGGPRAGRLATRMDALSATDLRQGGEGREEVLAAFFTVIVPANLASGEGDACTFAAEPPG